MALRKATPARWHHEDDEQPRFPPPPGDRDPVFRSRPVRSAAAPLRIGQAASVRCSLSTTASPPRSARLPVPVASPTDRTIRPRRSALYRPRAAFSAWVAQMTSVATERDPATVRARAQSRRSVWPFFQGRCERCLLRWDDLHLEGLGGRKDQRPWFHARGRCMWAVWKHQQRTGSGAVNSTWTGTCRMIEFLKSGRSTVRSCP